MKQSISRRQPKPDVQGSAWRFCGKRKKGILKMDAVNINIEELEHLLRQAGNLFQDRTAAGQVQTKGIADYVTAVDYAVQQYIQEHLEASYPHIQFLSEEKANQEIDQSGLVWVLDPVDGTTNLIHDYHTSCISLALMGGGEVALGMIYNPYSKELFQAKKGGGSYLNGERITVSGATRMEESLIAIGTSPYHKEMADENFELFKRLFLDCQDIRRSGSAALDLAHVACGRLEGYFEIGLKIWDFAAGMLLVREAGGSVLDYSGAQADTSMVNNIVAGNSEICRLLASKYL